MQEQAPVFVLPTEPLLEQPSRGLGSAAVARDVAAWLEDLSSEIDLEVRAESIFKSLRKNLGDDKLLDMFEGVAREANDGTPRGIAALASMVAVRAPGRQAAEELRHFHHLHRTTVRFQLRLDRGGSLEPREREFLAKLARLDSVVAEMHREVDPTALPAAKDLGPAGTCRRAFARIWDRLDNASHVRDQDLDLFIQLARLELTAIEMRAEHLASSINPYSARQVSEVMPRLAAIDTFVRDTRAFLAALAESKKPEMFRETHPVFRDHLESRELQRLLERLKEREVLSPVFRLMHRMDRNPMPLKRLAYFAHITLSIGHVLESKRMRQVPMTLVDALLLVLEFADDHMLLPASEAVRQAILLARIEGVEPDEGAVRVDYDDFAAGALNCPMGLPLPVVESDEEEKKEEFASIKDFVADNINKTSVLLGLLKNPKISGTPGVVTLVVQRCRNMRVMETICETRSLYTGVANKEVAASILKSPMRIPVKTLRRFINVRYVPKVDLRRMAIDRSSIRREVAEEIERYLKSLV